MAAALGAPSEAPPQSSEPVVRPASPYGLAAGSSPAVQPVSRTEVARPAPAVTGRCVDWEHGNPLLGCEIAIAGFSVRTRSDADGRFTLPLPSGSRGADRRLRIGAQGRLSVERVVPAGGELGEVRLRLGVAVSGTLHDDALAPQGGATVRLRATAAGRGDGWSEHWSTQAVTDFEGSFAFADVVPAGVAVVELDEAPPLLGSASHALGPGDRAFLALRCGGGGPAERIEGRVRDPHGRPLANALVQARDGGGTVASARSDAAGEFRLFRGHGRSTSVRLIATSLAGDGATAPTAPVDWGTRDLVLELAPAPGILLRVTDAATGAPLERYSVQCVATTGMRSSAEGRRRADGQHPDGRCLLAVSRPGPNVLIVWPEDPRWLPSLPRSFDRDGCGGRLEVTLARAEACPVAVVDPAGRPLAGVDVELVLPAPAAEIVRDLDRLLVDGGVRVPVDLRVARARTDADGRARLCWRTGAVPCELRLSGGGIAPHVEPGVQLSTAGVTVRVGATAVLAVRIAGGGPVRVALREVDGARRVPEAWAAPLVVTGAAEFAVPPGQWQVFAARPVTIDGRSCREWIELPEPVATVALAAGRTAELELDLAAALAPSCVVRGVALVDGQPASHLVLLCGEVGPDGRVRPRRLIEGRADGRGWFAFEGLRPGAYSLQLRLRCSGRTIAVPLAGGEWHVLATGEQWMPATVDLATAAVRIRVPGASSAAGSGRLVELYSAARIALVGELDAGDDVAFDRVPVGSYRVRLRDVTGDVSPVELGRLEVAGAGPVAVELPIAPR